MRLLIAPGKKPDGATIAVDSDVLVSMLGFVMTNEELLRAAGLCPFNRKTVDELGAHLPADDEEVDRLLEAAIEARDDIAFANLLFAALGANRPPDAHHLVRGTALLATGQQLVSAAWHLRGDVAAALLQAVQSGGFFFEQQAIALMMAGIWCRYKQQMPVRPEIVAHARILARRMEGDAERLLDLGILACITQDQPLIGILGSRGTTVVQQPPDKIVDIVLELYRDSPVAFIPTEGDPFAVAGHTVRREAPVVGRNDPCPCGSGKKYKKCCLEKDLERARQSPSLETLQVQPRPPVNEAKLTLDQILELKLRDLLQVDPTKLPPPLFGAFLRALTRHHEMEAAVRALEQARPHIDHWNDWWDELLWEATHDNDRPLIHRLLQMRHDPEFKFDQLDIATRVLLATEAPNPALDLLNAEALALLRHPDDDALLGLAYSLLDGTAPALGILLARGVLLTATEIDGWMLLDTLLSARDKLNLDPQDPAEACFDERFSKMDSESEADSPELIRTLEELKANHEELRRLRQKLLEAEKELERQARLKSSAPTPAMPLTPAGAKAPDEAAVQDLRQKLESLKAELKDRHAERAQLRRELQQSAAALDELKKRPESAPGPTAESPGESALFDETDTAAIANHVFRLPEFPKKFQEQLDGLPKPVVRHALTLIGRLSAGEPTAFQGLKRLHADREVCRQRVGTDHRLLFRLKPQNLEIVALINRRDLDRTVKNLFRQ